MKFAVEVYRSCLSRKFHLGERVVHLRCTTKGDSQATIGDFRQSTNPNL
jgi:hypothetical protein